MIDCAERIAKLTNTLVCVDCRSIPLRFHPACVVFQCSKATIVSG